MNTAASSQAGDPYTAQAHGRARVAAMPTIPAAAMPPGQWFGRRRWRRAFVARPKT